MTKVQKRKQLERLLSNEKVLAKKYHYGAKQVIVLPSPIQKKDMNDYSYAKDIDEKVVKMAASLAERMAISMVREMLSLNIDAMTDKIVTKVADKIAEALPEQQTIIQQVAYQESLGLKKNAEAFILEGAELNIDRSKGLKLHGSVGEKTQGTESTDEALDALDDLI